MEHIDAERIRDFATELLTDLTEAENNHVEECTTCRSRLAAMLKIVMVMEAELLDFITCNPAQTPHWMDSLPHTQNQAATGAAAAE